MLCAPRKLVFAVEAVLDIAYNAGGAPVQSSDITRRQGISRRYLEPVLQQLVRAGILVGVRGPKGGYKLARERRRISLGNITRVVLEPDGAADADEAAADSALGRDVVRPLWQEIEADMVAHLDGISIEDLCLRAREAGLESERFANLDFSI